jgi:hypothetical protein
MPLRRLHLPAAIKQSKLTLATVKLLGKLALSAVGVKAN